jgi:SAM-dependent methyltransferase
MPDQEQIAAAYEAAAPNYDNFGVPFFTAIGRQLVRQAGISVGDRVLDIGCGAGAVTLPAARAVGPAGQVAGIDLSPKMLTRTAAACEMLDHGNVTLTLADAHDPPYEPGSFDAVLASMLVFLLADPGTAAGAWRQLLRPGGSVAFSWIVAEDPLWQPVIAAVDAYVPGGSGFEALLHHPPFCGINEVEAMLTTAGYTDIATTTETVESRYTGPRHWWAVSWSQAPRIVWQHIPVNRRAAARGDAIRLLEPLRSPDGALIRQSLIACTTAKRPKTFHHHEVAPSD